MFPRIPLSVLALLYSVFVAFMLSTMAHAITTNQITYPEKAFANGKARHFIYKTNDGVVIRYLILKSSDGVIRAAFDACDVCWPENKGYSQKDDFMVCNNCGKRFPSTRINEVSGGCNPAPLNRKLENGSVIIQATDILQGKRYFEFQGQGVKR